MDSRFHGNDKIVVVDSCSLYFCRERNDKIDELDSRLYRNDKIGKLDSRLHGNKKIERLD